MPRAEAEAMALLRRSSAGIRLCRSLCSWLGSGVLNFLCGTTEAAKPNALPSSAWCSSVKLYKKLVSANKCILFIGKKHIYYHANFNHVLEVPDRRATAFQPYLAGLNNTV